ncbi:DUF4901 domain-containing protein [Desulfosporosinus shakirovi]|uniref:DUF4901 domain-containing protein n=1 Tax=Desulfosporosinus shakirovi TaxID=2885154 RepID=UPI001E5D8FA2|nr:DUF4901 domain-containing protein [Desulfosporosinus sp. SRJS8]MCB8814776.1 DUF4901 domain-containing protein [Desulfosporosinus sp. SRJS8]
MPFDYGELRTKAKAIVQIPEHYRLAMEDNTRDEQERSFNKVRPHYGTYIHNVAYF